MTAVLITGYLQNGVTDSKHKSAREASRFLKSVVKKAGGTVTKLEVMQGKIFITLKDQTGVAELKAALTPIQGVIVDEPEEAMLVYIRETARVEAEILAKGAGLPAKSAA